MVGADSSDYHVLGGTDRGLREQRVHRPADQPRPSAPAAGPVVLVDLGDPAAVAGWTTVNDPVMGGRSTSTVAFGDGGLVFSGNISLDNNGGFASARGPVDAEIGRRATGATSLRVRALGDGKTYVLKVGTGSPGPYIQRFATDAGVRRTYDLPASGFEAGGHVPRPGTECSAAGPVDHQAGRALHSRQAGGLFQLVVSSSTLQAEGSEGRLTSSHATETQ